MRHSVKSFCITFFLLGVLFVVSQQIVRPSQSGSPTDNQATPTVGKSLGDAKTPVAPDNANPAADKINRAEWVQIFINGFVALVILWQAWTYYQQRRIMNQQVETARIAERGYVGIKSTTLGDFEVGKTPFIEVVFLNGGRTPIWNFYSPGTLLVDTKPPEDVPPKPEGESGGFLPAGISGKVRYYFPIPANSQVIAEITTGRLKLYLRVEVWFEDCWGEPRSDLFRLVYLPKLGIFQDYKKYAEYMETKINRISPSIKRPTPN